MTILETRHIEISKTDTETFMLRNSTMPAIELAPFLKSTGQIHQATSRLKQESRGLLRLRCGSRLWQSSKDGRPQDPRIEVIDADDCERWIIAIAENLGRANLSAVENERAIANVETARMSERIRSGLARAKSEGKHVGRPKTAYTVSAAQIAQERAAGACWGTLASKYSLLRTSVRRPY